MALCFLLDENLRGQLWYAIGQHNALGVDVLDALRVGDPPAPPLGILDPDLLLWCEAHRRVLVSLDKNTLPGHLGVHWQAGHHVPGVFLLRSGWTIPTVIALLVLYDQAFDPVDLVDAVIYIP